jgi:hypothetical protein
MPLKNKHVRLVFPKLHLHKGEHTVSALRLTLFVILFACIGTYVIVHDFADANQAITTLQTEQMTLPSGAVIIQNAKEDSNGEHVRFDSAGTATSTVTIPQYDSVSSITVRMDARACQGYPDYSIKVNNQEIASSGKFTDTNWNTYSYNDTLSSGTYPVSISTGNDHYYSASCIRALKVDDISFYGNVGTPPQPTLAFSANPTTVNAGGSSSLTWSTTNASSCVASGSWSGSEPTSGSASTGALSNTGTYILKCSNSVGTVSQTATVTVKPNGGGGGTTGPGNGILSIGTGQGTPSYLGNTTNYKYIILQDSMAAADPSLITTIHADNPNTKVLMYMNSSFISNDCTTPTDSPITTCEANNNPSWYIESGGSPITEQDFTYQDWANISSSTYQSTWLANANTIAKQYGFDGLFMDDTNTYIGHGMDSDLPGYTDETYGEAELAFLKYESAGLHADGLLAVPNVGFNIGNSQNEAIAEQMAPYADAFFDEMFMNWDYYQASQVGQTGLSSFTGAAWTDLVNLETQVGSQLLRKYIWQYSEYPSNGLRKSFILNGLEW